MRRWLVMRVAVAPAHLATHVEHIKAAGQSPRTVKARIEVISSLSRTLEAPLPHATTEQLVGWLARPGLSRATRANYRMHIRAYYRWLSSAGLILADPSDRLPSVRVPLPPPRTVPNGVLAHILSRARQPYRTYYVLAAYGGLRCGEIAILDTGDVTVEAILVRGKGDKVRYVDTHPLVWGEIDRLPRGPVFHLWDGSPVEALAAKMSRRCNEMLDRVGAKQITMHMLRHWFAATMYRQTGNLEAVRELLGHISISTTQRYMFVSSEERRSAVRSLPAVAAQPSG